MNHPSTSSYSSFLLEELIILVEQEKPSQDKVICAYLLHPVIQSRSGDAVQNLSFFNYILRAIFKFFIRLIKIANQNQMDPKQNRLHN